MSPHTTTALESHTPRRVGGLLNEQASNWVAARRTRPPFVEGGLRDLRWSRGPGGRVLRFVAVPVRRCDLRDRQEGVIRAGGGDSGGGEGEIPA